ncbi:kinase-like domain-containing protein [Russula dissimulans]|nr:kinase-like domain-containing protein [Russula dissimulans]
MLLTGKDDIPFFDGMRDTVPAPPQIVGSRDAGLQARSHKAQLFAPAPPEDLTTMMLHTTAAAGRSLVDIPMMRLDKMQTPVTHVRSADVYLKDFLGAGSFGRVFLAELFIHDLCYGQVVVKLANAGVEAYLDIEARAYAKLRSLRGVGIPGYYGHFTGEHAGVQYSCILIDVCGDPVKTIPSLPLFQRLEIFRILLMIHRQGVMHNDLSPMNILSTKSRMIRLIDFSAAIIDHECSGVGSCWELNSAVTELRLTPLHTQFVILWSHWPDIFHPSMSRQSTVAIPLVLFVFVFAGLWSTYSKGLLL